MGRAARRNQIINQKSHQELVTGSADRVLGETNKKYFIRFVLYLHTSQYQANSQLPIRVHTQCAHSDSTRVTRTILSTRNGSIPSQGNTNSNEPVNVLSTTSPVRYARPQKLGLQIEAFVMFYERIILEVSIFYKDQLNGYLKTKKLIY